MSVPDQIKDDARKHFMRIRELNDALRTSTELALRLIINGQLVITRGIAARGDAFFHRALAAVRSFNDFTPDNDPHGEHDMAFLDVEGERIYFKIDYYDPALEYHSKDPSDPGITRRILTIALAEEY
jgi:hypothetical protein